MSEAIVVDNDEQLELGFGQFGDAPEVFTIIPPEEECSDLAEFEPILLAQHDLQFVPSHAGVEEVSVVIDTEVHNQVVEILGTCANLGFDLGESVNLPYLVMHIKNVNKFFRIELTVLDSEGLPYTIRISNRQSVVKVKNNLLSMPLKMRKGWNRVCIDLADVLENGWGVEYNKTLTLRIFANCRIWRLFFQRKDYADIQLPQYLRVRDE